ncbi:MAG: RNA-binding cell elongation regulator Jag/EloR [Candidatus Fimenecus sp.]
MIKEAIGTGSTVDEAKAAAMLELGISDFDDFTVEVLQTPAKKILGLFGGSPAKVKVSVEKPDEKPERKEKPNKKVEKKAPVNKENKKAEKKEKAEAPKEEKPELPLEKTNLYADTADYIKSIVLALGMSECEITEMSNEEEIYFELQCGDDYGIIIGKRGETLDALQYLARMIANKGSQNYKRVSINVGNYREKREETLKILARKTASKAVRQGRSISLEPMNPYERRIIHTAVQEVEGASSHSVGSDLDRRVVITPVDGGRRGNSQRGRSGGYRDRGRREKREPYTPEISPDRAPKSDIDGSSLYGKVEIRSAAPEENTEE